MLYFYSKFVKFVIVDLANLHKGGQINVRRKVTLDEGQVAQKPDNPAKPDIGPLYWEIKSGSQSVTYKSEIFLH